MSFSRRARRGISIFQKLQWSEKRALYHLSQKRMINLNAKPQLPPVNPEVAAAATEAMEILVRNGEKANANIQELPEGEGHTVSADPQGSPKHNVSGESQDGQGSPESGPAGA
jgi:hypothetical protein